MTVNVGKQIRGESLSHSANPATAASDLKMTTSVVGLQAEGGCMGFIIDLIARVLCFFFGHHWVYDSAFKGFRICLDCPKEEALNGE